MPDYDQSDEFPLADLIHALSEQLRRSESRAHELSNSGNQPLIAWIGAQIEVGVTWSRDVHGQIDVKVLQLGGARTKENTATMTVTLGPADNGPKGPLALHLVAGDKQWTIQQQDLSTPPTRS